MKKRKFKNRTAVVLRSMTVTLVMLTCAVSAVIFMGKSYEAMEFCSKGVEVSAVYSEHEDYITVFEKEYYFPINTAVSKVENALNKYTPSIIKLLKTAVDGTEEFFKKLIEN